MRAYATSMEFSCSSPVNPCLSLKPRLLTTLIVTISANTCVNWRNSNKKTCRLQVSALSYRRFIDFAVNETKNHTVLWPSPLQEKYSSVTAMDEKTELKMVSFETPKIRLLRGLTIENEAMQVLDFAGFARPEFDVPVFCANFFTNASMNIIVLDLNPLYSVIERRDYKERYYKRLMPVVLEYAELFPWGGKLTSESLDFFSPIVIWSKFTSSQYRHDGLFSAFTEYYKVWLKLIDQAVEETDVSQIKCNCEAQHKYLTWRAEKDPGHGLLKRLIGERSAKDLVRNFLFNGIDELGSKSFLDYFPEYLCEDGTINEKRSMLGKSFDSRPWDAEGELIGNNTPV